ncbi:T9SS type A sorting domain-containing protein [uncultured Dokdonia sp.]|uniref:VPS10 domain-containing protein n=1 Tax=uncultured Dokdonia sp. TaxID=575653 RepID=UPI002629C068|nr:T9SS type A sorting domain-containing protein [uncultured Dokdonia sp.]
MKIRTLFLLVIACFLGLVIVQCTTKQDAKETLTEKKYPTGKSPFDLMFMQRAYPTGELKPNAYREAALWKQELEENSTRNTENDWNFVGPVNIGGRITDIEIVSETNDIIYVAAASGGIFRTVDNGVNWEPIFDDQPMLAIGDMEVSKSNSSIIAVGTGEVNAGGGSLAYDGDGVYVSNDGGDTWDSRGLEEVGSIGKVIIDPTNPLVMYVGAMGPLFKNDTNRGVYRTTDGGTTWEQILFISDKTGIVDMAIHPTDAAILYAVAWERERTPENRSYGGETSGIYRSTDGGDNWEELTTGLPTEGSQKGRISIDIATSNPNVLYASYADEIGSVQGFYKSTNGGDSWSEINSSQIVNVGFHWWFGGLFINPEDEDEVYHVGFEIQKTTDGGDTWQFAFPGVHVDQHAMAFHPDDASNVFLGNDGGLYTSTNSGATSVKDLTLPITQFYRFTAETNGRLYGGSQDNSTMRTITGSADDWTIINGGDGFQPLINKDNNAIIYALAQRGSLRRSTNDAASFQTILNGIEPSDRNNWDTPIAFDPHNNDILYYGTQRVYRTINGGDSWSAISGDLTNGPSTGNLNFGSLTSIDVSTLDHDIIYTGADDGSVWRTLDGGTTWENISSALPNRWVTKVKASTQNPQEVFVTLSGYRFGENDGHIFHSFDAGDTWTDITANLPDIPVNDIEFSIYEGYFVATDVGVFRAFEPGDDWEVFGDLPSVVVNDLYIGDDFLLYAGTYGRSAYRAYVGELSVEEFSKDNILSVFPNPASLETTFVLDRLIPDADLIIYNQLGQVVLQQKIETLRETISIQNLSKGMYFVQVKGNNEVFSRKLIKN